MIVKVCDDVIGTDGKIRKMSKKQITKIDKQNAEMASRGMRVLALAMRELEPDDLDIIKDPDAIEQHLTFVGLVGIMDPPRAQVKPTIVQCKDAGVLQSYLAIYFLAIFFELKFLSSTSGIRVCMMFKTIFGDFPVSRFLTPY